MDLERDKGKKRTRRRRYRSPDRHERKSRDKRPSLRRSKQRGNKTSAESEDRKRHKRRKRHRTESDSESSSSSASSSPARYQRESRERPRTMVHYLQNRSKLLETVFTCLSSTYIDSLLPEVFQGERLSVVRKRCFEQLEKLTDNEIRLLIEGKTIPLPPRQEDDNSKKPLAEVASSEQTANVGNEKAETKKDVQLLLSNEDKAGRVNSVRLSADDMIELMVTESDMLDDESDVKGTLLRGKRASASSSMQKAKRVFPSEAPSAVAADSTTSSHLQDVPISTEREEAGDVSEVSIAELELRHRALQAELRRETASNKIQPATLPVLPEPVSLNIQTSVCDTKFGSHIVVSPALLNQHPGVVPGLADDCQVGSTASGKMMTPVPVVAHSNNSPSSVVEEEEESQVEAAVKVGLHNRTNSTNRPSVLPLGRSLGPAQLPRRSPGEAATERPSLDELRLRERALKSMIVAQAKQKKLI